MNFFQISWQFRYSPPQNNCYHSQRFSINFELRPTSLDNLSQTIRRFQFVTSGHVVRSANVADITPRITETRVVVSPYVTLLRLKGIL
jgi:hypothetical protein